MQFRVVGASMALIICNALCSPKDADAQNPSASAPPTSIPFPSISPTPIAPTPSPSATAPALSLLSPQDLLQLRQDYQLLRERLESSAERTNQVYILLAILVGMFGFSAVAWFKSEHRATESYKLAMIGERASQSRDISIFEQSQRTLTLVNETLELAKEASARASKSLENRLRKTSHELEKQCIDLIEDVEAFKNDKNLVSNRETTSRIHSLGLKIKALENNLVLLEAEALKLEPYCGFINGLDSHLHEDYNEAIKLWEFVAADKDTPPELRSLAFYWLGYVHNNLRQFPKAIHNLEHALEGATGSRRFEVRRLQLESRFFTKDNGDELIKLLENLLREFDKQFPDQADASVVETKRRIQTTLGNIYFQTGKEKQSPDYFGKAKVFFEEAITAKWGSFGLAETLFKLGERDRATELYKGPVLKEAEKEFMVREELRTKVLAKTTQLVCDVRAQSPEQHIKDRYDDVISLLADVDSRLTIYSQLQRRNVSKEDFLKDLTILLNIGA
jgi:tetratricopeptide (TPR) repeat protein